MRNVVGNPASLALAAAAQIAAEDALVKDVDLFAEVIP